MSKKLSDFPVYEQNPSLGLGNFKNFKLKKKNLLIEKAAEYVNEETGEILGLVKLRNKGSQFFMIDDAEFVKVYRDFLVEFMNLSSCAGKLLFYIFGLTKADKDTIRIDITSCASDLGYKNARSVYIGLFELLEKEFIFRKTGTAQYYINVRKFFNGKRGKIEDFREYIKSVKDIADNNLSEP